jgi:uncharacterized membrane protein YuzA (DUF378 family)
MTPIRSLLLALVAAFAAAAVALVLGAGSAGAALAYAAAGISALVLAGQVEPKQRLVTAPRADRRRHG